MKVFDINRNELNSENIDLSKGRINLLIETDEKGNKRTVQIYSLYTKNDLQEKEKSELRQRRIAECFSIVDRGELWYETLTATQKQELKIWYQAWLDVPQTKQIPQKPNWLK